MKTKKYNRTPTAFTREARRLLLYDSFGNEQIINIIPQMCFRVLLTMPDDIIGKIIRHQILFVMSDGEHDTGFSSNNPEFQECFEQIMEVSKRYMVMFRTRKKKCALHDKKQISIDYIDDGSDMQELSEISKLSKNVLAFDVSTALKQPEEMPIMEDL